MWEPACHQGSQLSVHWWELRASFVWSEAKLRFKIKENRSWHSVVLWAQCKGYVCFGCAELDLEKLAVVRKLVIYSFAEKYNKFTSTDQRSLHGLLCLWFFVDQAICPGLHRGS